MLKQMVSIDTKLNELRIMYISQKIVTCSPIT
jgi:hypothetical protein